MTRWRRTAAVVAALAVLVGSAGPAGAQQPGRNGERNYVFETFFMTACLMDQDLQERFEAAGGMSWARGGARLTITAETVDDVGNRSAPAVFVLGTAPCTEPRRLGAADARSTGSFSPSGKQLAVQRKNRIVILDVATGRTVRDIGAGKDPSWSPDGKRIAYVDGTTIKTRPAIGGAARTFKANATAPDYSPDGTKIAYLTGGKIAYAATSNSANVRRTPISAVDFSWSPDGTKVIYTRPDRASVNVSTLSGIITERYGPGGWDGYAAWQPLPL